MRLLTLELLRYGPFTGKVLKFRPDARLHLVFGPNEAGKSSSLAAIGDLLFGFPKRREYDFLHEASSLRVGAEIQSRSGDTLSFRRRRGNKKTLLDDDMEETPLLEDALSPYLGNLSREVFARAFGLNSETLRQGGSAMLESGGEMGAALFAAASGLTGLARIRRGLEAEADGLFAARASKERRFYQVMDRYETAITAERRNELKAVDWRALVTEIDDTERQLSALKSRRTDVAAGLARLQRLKMVEPILAAIGRLGDQLRGFDDLPDVPPGFAAECSAALDLVEGAKTQERLAEDELAAALAGIEAITLDEKLLEHSAHITELFSQRGDYLSKVAELPGIEAERDGFTQTLRELGQRLGFADPEEMVRQVPAEAVVENARVLAKTGAALEAAIAADERRLQEERGAISAQEAEDGARGLFDPKPWRDQFNALGPELKELGEQAYLESTYRGMAAKLRDAALRLVPPVADITTVSLVQLPTRDRLGYFKAEFERILSERRAETSLLESNARQIAEADQKLAEAERGGPVAYEETIQLVRGDRDSTFEQLRTHLLRSGRLLTPDEVSALLVQFEEETIEADGLADQAIANARLISAVLGYREKIEELEQQRPEIEARLEALAAEQSATARDYSQLFAASGMPAMAPDAMVSWLSSVEELLVTRREVESLATQIAGLDDLGGRLHVALVDLARSIGVEGISALPPLALARLVGSGLDEMQDRWTARLTLEGARQAAHAGIGKLEESLARQRREYKEWRYRFQLLLPSLGLDSRITAGAAGAALSVWAAVPDVLRERASRAARVEAMRRDITAFFRAVYGLAEELLPMLVELPAHGLIDVLRERADNARAAKARQDDARVRVEVAQARLAAARGQHGSSHVALDRLRAMLPDGANLRQEIGRLKRRETLRQELADKRREFEICADGVSEATIRTELPGFVRDRAPLDVEDLERESETLLAENNRLYARLGQAQSRRDALEAGSGSELAAFERSSAETEIVAIARSWAVRKIAAAMLAAAIEKHRESQSDPLLSRAGALFSTLTSGSFSGLAEDYGEDDQPQLVGVRNRGERVPIAGMSEGTRDQLYLSLRLAYIEDYATRTEPVPFIGDDIFQTFDDERTDAGLRALAGLATGTQPVLFTHHLSVVAIARRALGNDLDYVEL